jgi:hypothetical protein
MAKPYNDAKFALGEPIASMLKDFCAANYNAPALEIIRVAVKEHINRRLENLEMRERYETARKERLGLPDKVVKLAKQGDRD